MTLQRGLDARTRPMETKAFAVNSALPAGGDLDLACQVQRAAFHERRSTRTYYFLSDHTAPIIFEVSVYDTAVDYEFYDKADRADFLIPWLPHPNATSIRAVVYVALSNFDLDHYINMETSTMVDSITTATSDWVKVEPSQRMPSVGWWNKEKFNPEVNAPPYTLGTATIELEPTYPADRADPICVSFDGKWASIADITAATKKRTSAIMAVRLFDVIEKPDPES